jgi:AraC-like DNA-binding protein
MATMEPRSDETIHRLSDQIHRSASTIPRVDGMTGFLDGPRARDAFVLRSVLDPPWSLRIEDEAPLTVVVLLRAGCWIRFDDAEPVAVDEGDVAVIRGPDPYVVSDAVDTEPSVVIHPGQVCTDRDGTSVAADMALGIRTWGTSTAGSSVLLTATYTTDGELSDRLLAALPRLLVLRRDEWTCPYLDLLATETTSAASGQEVVLDRLVDLVLIGALRTWFARPETDSPAWFGAQTDPVVGPALALLHDDPARTWTVGGLAAEVGVSRAALARRFTELVGEPPMTYLSGWRLALAADLLREPTATVTSVARQVGYQSPFTFSTAFKRHYGCSPSDHRARHREPTEPGDVRSRSSS